MPKKLHFLFAILNWGLGHATRSIPIINRLIDKGCDVSLASDGRAKLLLEKEFPTLTIHDLPAYNISYSKKGSPFFLAKQMIRLPHIINKERKAIAEIINKEDIDVLISDNRYGCYHSSIPSVFITHQLFIKSPFRFPLVDKILSWKIKNYISNFNEVWIPDVGSPINLSGDLSHKEKWTSPPCFFIGPLSRFKKKKVDLIHDIAVVLSGPEPQRSILEEKLMAQVKALDIKAIIVRGVSEGSMKASIDGNSTIIDYLTSERLNDVLLKSKVLIGRPGYTSVMDIAKLEKPAIFIPTPGQSEQEYLASLYKSQQLYYSEKQDEFLLKGALETYSSYKNKIDIDYDRNVIKERIDSILKSV